MDITPDRRGMRPSIYNECTLIDSSPHISKDYPFSKRINRIYEKKQIALLFDEEVETNRRRKNGPSEYYGTISGIDVKIDFSVNRPCFVYAKSEKDLGKAYNQILDILIKRN
jgi:hypothetical protein